jgi:hypothetical protein
MDSLRPNYITSLRGRQEILTFSNKSFTAALWEVFGFRKSPLTLDGLSVPLLYGTIRKTKGSM